MTSGDEYFTPEQVDEQIEQLQRTTILDGPTDEARLVNVLDRYYRIPFTAEDRAALERVRQHIMDNQSTGDTLEERNDAVIPLAPLSLSNQVARPRHARLMRILSSVAAVILVGVLIGGWLAVTRMASPSTTVPASVPENIYVVQNGVAYCLSGSSGKVIWQEHLSTSKKSGSASLRVVNNVVYVVLDFDIYALNASTGAQVWHVTDHTGKAYFYSVVDSGRLYLYSLDNTFSALNTSDGSVVWHNTTFTTQDGYGFSVSDGNLYTKNDNGTTLYTLDGATGQVRWHLYLSQITLSEPPLVANGVVYAASGNLLYALKEDNGVQIWKQTVPVLGDFATSYLANGILYVTNDTPIADVGSQHVDNRNFYAYNAQTGRLLWTAQPGYNTLFNLPITDGLLLAARNYNGAYSIGGLNPQTGKVVWEVPFKCGVSRFNQQVSPTCSTIWTAVMNGNLYLLESDSQSKGKAVYTLKSFNLGTGRLLSTHQLTFEQQDTVAVVGASNGLLYLQLEKSKWANGIPYSNYLFAAYRLSGGVLVWSHMMPSFPPPTSANTQPNTSQPVLAP